MTKNTIANVFKAEFPKGETASDKTTRIVKQLVDEEMEQRQAKNARLRNARLKREANTPPVTTLTTLRKTRSTKAVSNS